MSQNKQQFIDSECQGQSQVAFIFIGSAQNFESDYDRQNLIDQGVSFQHANKGKDEQQLIRQDKEALYNHAKSLKLNCDVISFESLLSKNKFIKKSQVISFLIENINKYKNFSEINIHFDGPSIKYKGDWVFYDNQILKQEELLQIAINQQFRNNLIIVSNCNYSNELLERYNKGVYDKYICYFSTLLFISTCHKEQNYHSFYQFYNFQCRNCCFVKQLNSSYSNECRIMLNQQEQIELSNSISPSNVLLDKLVINQINICNQSCPSHRFSNNELSTQANTARNQYYQSNIQPKEDTEKKYNQTVDNSSNQTNIYKKSSIMLYPQSQHQNQNARNSFETKSQDVSYELLSTDQTFNINNNQSLKGISHEQIKYFFSSIHPVNRTFVNQENQQDKR
ncbi:hypothetical protein ABPG74_014785 [Tetrahymena malaccensis]